MKKIKPRGGRHFMMQLQAKKKREEEAELQRQKWKQEREDRKAGRHVEVCGRYAEGKADKAKPTRGRVIGNRAGMSSAGVSALALGIVIAGTMGNLRKI